MQKLATFLAAKGGASNGIRKLGNALLGAGLAVALGFAIADGNPATAQTWTELFPTGGPSLVRTTHSAVHNPTSNRMIVFGGQNGGGFGVDPKLNDVWVLSNADGLGGHPVGHS